MKEQGPSAGSLLKIPLDLRVSLADLAARGTVLGQEECSSAPLLGLSMGEGGGSAFPSYRNKDKGRRAVTAALKKLLESRLVWGQESRLGESQSLPRPPWPSRPYQLGYGQEAMETYCSDGQPHLQVAEHNDAEWDDTARDHEDNHV